MAIGAWSDFETITVPAGVTLVTTTDTLAAGSSIGTSSARYKIDPEQTNYPAKLEAYIANAIAYGANSTQAYSEADTFMKFWRRKSANGLWFTLAEDWPTTGMFGCPGDGSISITTSATTGVMTWTNSGTDVFLNMQSFIDYCAFIKKGPGRIGNGTHRVSRGLQHGYSNPGVNNPLANYVSSVFTGAGQAYSGSSNFAGSAIICDTDEDPILNISADRDVVWRGVAFRGAYDQWMINTAIAYPTADPRPQPTGAANPFYGNYDFRDQNSWFANYLRRSQDGRYNPYALVTLGAYDGTKPVATAYANNTAYAKRDCIYCNGNVYQCFTSGTSSNSGTGPSGTGDLITDGTTVFRWLGAEDVTDRSKYVAYREPYRPAWLLNPTSSSYGNTYYGTFATFEHCYFYGGVVGLACKPGPNASQDDFPAMIRCNFNQVKYGFSAGNNQLRSLLIEGCQFGQYYCALTNNTHGNQTGSFKGGSAVSCGFGSGVDVLQMNATYGEPFAFIGCYSEGQDRLGQVLGGGRANMGPVFLACEWNLTGVNAVRGRAPRQYYQYPDGTPALINEAAPPTTPIPTSFINCKINVDSVFTCYVGGATFTNTQIYAYDRAGPVSPYLAFFNNALAGGLVLQGLAYRDADHTLLWDAIDNDSGSYSGHFRTDRGFGYGGRSICIPAMVKTVRAKSGTEYEELPVPQPSPLVLAKSSGAYTISYTTGGASRPEMKFIYIGANQATTADLQGFGPGSAVIDGFTGMVWAVRSFDPAAVGGPTLYAVAQNNFTQVGTIYNFVQTPTTNTGSIAFLHARNYTPDTPLFGDFTVNVTAIGTSGSPNLTSVVGSLVPGQPLTHANIPAGTTVLSVNGNTAVMTANATGVVSGSIVMPTTIANVGTSAGSGTTISTNIAVGDYLVSPQQLRALAPATAKVTATTNGSPGSITIDQNAIKTSSGQRLSFFRRPCPANV